jgi:predicted phage-related endonuclease
MTKCKNECPENKFNGCCAECPHGSDCESKCTNDPQTCGDAVFEGTALEVFNSKAEAVIQKITLLVKQKAEIEKQEKTMREQLQQAMEAHDVKKFDNDLIKITYVEASTRTSVDSAKLKAQQPDIYAKFSKTSPVKAFVKIESKDGDK